MLLLANTRPRVNSPSINNNKPTARLGRFLQVVVFTLLCPVGMLEVCVWLRLHLFLHSLWLTGKAGNIVHRIVVIQRQHIGHQIACRRLATTTPACGAKRRRQAEHRSPAWPGLYLKQIWRKLGMMLPGT